MNELIKFETVDIRKRELFDLIRNTLEENGWMDIASNPSSEGMIYQSKGEDGKQNILINFFDGHDLNNNTKFSTTNHQYFDARCLIDYTPSDNIGDVGTSVPARSSGVFNRIRLNIGYSNMPPDYRMRVRYNCNKNRIILLMTTEHTTTILMAGKSDRMLSKEYSNTGNTLFASYSYKNSPIMSYGVADRNPTGVLANQAIFVNPPRGIYDNEIILSEIGFGNAQEGIRGYLDGVYRLSLNTTHVTKPNMNEDIITDELGNEFTILYYANTDSGNYPCPFTACNIVVCTKKAGE